MKQSYATLLFLLLVGQGETFGQTSYPMVTHVHPVAIQRGKTAEVVIEGQMSFQGAYKILFEGQGIIGEVEAPAASRDPRNARTVRAKVTVADEALPGVREFRIVTATGVSSVGQLLVVDDPVLVETANNNQRGQAAAMPLPGVACGKIEALEDVDFYKFTAEAGKVITLEVQAARIQDKIHDLQKHADPLLTLYDASGRELASNDDRFFADPLLTYRIEKAGEYFIQVRDAKYDGDPRWVYALLVTDKPQASLAFPLAVQAGQEVEVEPIGSARLVRDRVAIRLPGDAKPGIHWQRLELNGEVTSPIPFWITPLATTLEKEPNDQVNEATRITLPCCCNGRISSKSDADHFLFTGKRGQAVRFEVRARRFGTPLVSGLDAVIDVLNKNGNVLATGDDVSPAVKDASVVFSPPADGDYVLRVRDLLHKGGEEFVYAVEADYAAPDFTLRCDGDKAMIASGASTPWFVQVNRLNGFTGPVAIEVAGLPPGVTASKLVIPSSMTQGVVVLTADKEAKPDASGVTMTGKAVVKAADGQEHELVRRVDAEQEIYLPGGGRGRFGVNMQTVAITDPGDVARVEVTPATLSLKPGEEIKLQVKVHRRSGFDGAITLDVRLRHLNQVYGDPLPPGVAMDEGKSKTLLGKGSEGTIVLRAAPNAAAIEDVPICVIANVSVNFVVKMSYASEVVPVTVVKK